MSKAPTKSPGGGGRERPALRPGVAVIPMPGAIQLRAGDEGVFLLRTDRPRSVEALLEALDGTRRLEEILEGLRGQERCLLESLVGQLRSEGLLVDGPPDDLDPLESWLSLAVADPRGAAERLRGGSVVLAGHEGALDTIAGILGEHGIRAGVAPGGADDGADPEADVLVCAWERPDLAMVARVNRGACLHRRPCLFVDHSHGRHATVGPFFIPQESACYACFRRRLHENTAAYPELLAAEAAMERSGAPLPACGTLPAHRHQVAGLACAEVVAFLALHRPLRTLNRAVTLDLEGVRLWSEPVWRVPWCPECGDTR